MRLHIVLFGDKNLQVKLSNLAKHELSSEMIHSIEIAPLTLDETKQYLIYRLNRAGLSGPMPLSQMSIEKIYANSEGVPDRINRSAQQILLDDLSKQQSLAAAPSAIKKHQTKIIGGCLLVIALVAASYVLERQGRYSITQPQANLPVISFARQDHAFLTGVLLLISPASCVFEPWSLCGVHFHSLIIKKQQVQQFRIELFYPEFYQF